MPAAIAYNNLADSGTITASSSATLMPAARLQDPHVARKWRGILGSGEYLTVNLGSVRSIDTVALMGLNLTAAGTTRVRVSATDATGAAGELYDSGIITGAVDPEYGYLVTLLSAPVSGRYIRIDLTDNSLSYLEAGRLFVGARSTFAVNFAPGWSRAYVDRSRRTESRGGQVYIDRNVSYRTLECTFEWLTLAERNGFLEQFDRDIGERDSFLFIADPASANLGRDSIWGLVDSSAPIIQPYVIDVFSKAFRIRERL